MGKHLLWGGEGPFLSIRKGEVYSYAPCRYGDRKESPGEKKKKGPTPRWIPVKIGLQIAWFLKRKQRVGHHKRSAGKGLISLLGKSGPASTIGKRAGSTPVVIRT